MSKIKRIFLSIFMIILPFLLLFASGCSIFSRNPGGNAVVTVTVTVTETKNAPASRAPKPSPSPKAVKIEESITPKGEIYYKEGAPVKDIAKIPEKEAILFLLKNHYLTLKKDGNFHPGEAVQRDIYLLWLYKASQRKISLENTKKSHFSDVPPTHWIHPVIEGLWEAGAFKGYPGKKFFPGEKLTREEWCVLNSFFAADPQHIIDSVDSFPAHYKLCKYTDFKAVKKSNAKFVEYACSVLWTEETFGKALKKIPFRPQKPVTRREAAKWIYKYLKNLQIS